MRKICICLAAALLAAGCAQNGKKAVTPSEQWTPKQAQAWYAAQGWRSGCDYIPANAINQIEMWSEETFDAARIDKELGWAEELGFKTLRVYLSSVVWNHDAEGFKGRMDSFLAICEEHGIRPLFVFFDDCWNEESSYGPQPAPKPGIHNSGWVQDPSVSLRADTTALFPNLEAYVKDIVGHFRGDERILLWDVYNEPGNSGHKLSSMPLLKNAFRWAREAGNTQPLTAGVWSKGLPEYNAVQLELSDIISYHCYSDGAAQQAAIDTLRRFDRPIVCTEYMARTANSTFQNCLPVLKAQDVIAINWGFVAGKTNTIFAWSTPMPDVAEPPLWFHDILRQDGTPYSEAEVACIKQVNGIRE